MRLDESFPLEAVPPRVRHALLREFKGRCPNVREVKQIPDKDWLAAPGVGPTSLEMIRSITNAGRHHEVNNISSERLSDAELLRRLERLQEDLRWLEAQLKGRGSTGARCMQQRHREPVGSANEASQ